MAAQPKPFYTEAYSDTGYGPTVILLHGLFGNPSMWRQLITSLERDFRIIIPRLPLFDLPVRYTNIEYLTLVLHEFIIWHDLKDITLIGHDLGGQIAMKYAQLFQSNVKSLILIGSGLSHVSLHNDTDDNYDYVHKKVKDNFYDGMYVTNSLVDEAYDLISNVSKRSAIKSLSLASSENNVSSFLNLINLPVYLVWGLQDKITPPEVAIHLNDMLAQAEVEFINHCGHLPMLERADTFNQHLFSFLFKLHYNDISISNKKVFQVLSNN